MTAQEKFPKEMSITPANPLSFTLGNSSGSMISGGISCKAHASYIQNVVAILTGSDGAQVFGTFQGVGENVHMPLQSPSSGNVLKFDLVAPVTVSLEFSYSENRGRSWTTNSSNEIFPSIPYKSPEVEVVNVATEDSVDHDDNDTYLTLVAHFHS